MTRRQDPVSTPPGILAGFTVIVGSAFCWLSYRPLWHTDLWGHLAYGRTIWQRGRIPVSEPLMPLSSDIEFVDTAWLSQLIGYAAHRLLGIPALQLLYAGAIALSLALLIWCCYRRTQSVVWTLLGVALFVWVDWQQLRIIRPQLAGLVCFTGVLAISISPRWSRAQWLVVPALFAVWVNLHGSFPVGLLLLGGLGVGRAMDVACRTRRLKPVLLDVRVRRYLISTVLAAAAVLLNPYGWRVYEHVLSVSLNANLNDLVDWQPLTIRMKQGRAAAIAALLLVFVYRITPRRISISEVLLLVGLGGLALWASRMLLWWAPLAGYYVAINGNAAWGQKKWWPCSSSESSRSGWWTLITAGLAGVFVAFSSPGLSLLRGEQPDRRRGLSPHTPLAAAEYLKRNPPPGQIFNTYEWGDYLLWAGPKDLQVFVASHAHLVPRQVWRDYRRVIQLAPGWEKRLGRYDVATIVLDKTRHQLLVAELRQRDDWQIDFEDRRAVVFQLKIAPRQSSITSAHRLGSPAGRAPLEALSR